MTLLQDRMRSPVHMGALPDATGVGALGNPACGDVVTIHVRVADGVVADASFESLGSAYQLATASVLVDCVLGNPVAYAKERTPDCVLEKLPDLPANKRYLARLAVEALQRALGAPSPKAAADRPVLDQDEATQQVVDWLGAEAWTTREVEAMAEAEGVRLPGSTVRFLAGLRHDGVLEGEMDAGRKTWVWRIP